MSTMSSNDRVKRLKEHLARSNLNHEKGIMLEPSLKAAHVYCVYHNLSAQQYGPLLEKYLLTKFNYTKNRAKDCVGDCSKDGKNSEVKVSFGGKEHNKFNYVQIRPSHKCDSYIFIAYHLSPENVEDEGELYIFKVPKAAIKQIILSHGGYAHGTVKEHGKITADSLDDEASMREYALRPTIHDECWKALLVYRIPENEL
jgi:hypothetical protein